MKKIVVLLLMPSFLCAMDSGPKPLTMNDDGFVASSLKKLQGCPAATQEGVKECCDFTVGCGCCEAEMLNYFDHYSKQPLGNPRAHTDRPGFDPGVCEFLCCAYCHAIDDGGSPFPLFLTICQLASTAAVCQGCPPPVEYVAAGAGVTFVCYKLIKRKFEQIKNDPKISPVLREHFKVMKMKDN